MSKPLSLTFALLSLFALIAAGVSLSYFRADWALFFVLLSFAISGLGFAVKRRLMR